MQLKISDILKNIIKINETTYNKKYLITIVHTTKYYSLISG